MLWAPHLSSRMGPKSHGSRVKYNRRFQEEATVDLRVARAITSRVGAPMGAKQTDSGNGTANFSWSAKRAYRRARKRAANNGGTFYRGRWHTVSSLGAHRSSSTDLRMQPGVTDTRALQGPAERARLKGLTYNIGEYRERLIRCFVTGWFDNEKRTSSWFKSFTGDAGKPRALGS